MKRLHSLRNDYGKNMFARADFARMARLLAEAEGAFLLSINDTPEIREVFDGFEFEEVDLTYSISRAGGKKAAELIISNRVTDGRLL